MKSSKNNTYQIDDILEEAQRKKLERLKQPIDKQSLSEKSLKNNGNNVSVVNAQVRPFTPKKARANQLEKDNVDSPCDNSVEKAAKSVNTNKKPKPPKIRTVRFVPNPPQAVKSTVNNEEQDVKVYIPHSADVHLKEERGIPLHNKSHNVVEHPPVMDDEQHKQNETNSFSDDIPSKLPIEQELKDQDWEQRLKIERQKKAENFSLHPPVALRLSGEEEDNDPVEEQDVYEEEELEDYNSYEDTEAVRNELVYRRRMGWLRLTLTGLISLSLIGAAVMVYLLGWMFLNPVLYVGLNAFLLGIGMLINHRAMGEGFSSFFHLRSNVDSMLSISALLVLFHTLFQFLNLDTVANRKAIILTSFVAFGLFAEALGRQMSLIRITSNFNFVSYHGDKYAARIIEDRKLAAEVGRAAVAIGDPSVCYLEKTGFLTSFLDNSYESDAGDRVMRVYVPFILGASAILAVVYGLASGDIFNTITIFVSAVCLSTPLSIMTASNFPLLRSAKRVLRHGAMLVGWRAAKKFGLIHALAVDALELFPSESVLLHGIKTFSGTRIDEAILEAAAVSIEAGGPLSSVFRRVIQNKTDILQEVDSLVYEQGMGMSGWVGGRRVLIGNRRLLENHGVDVPSRDYENRYTKDDRQIVYLSTAGELSAMFVISYVADEGIAKALKIMSGAGITALVRTCDPNITEELICRVYDIDDYYIEVMSAQAGRCYTKLATHESKKREAVLATNGRFEGAAYGVTCCRRLHKAVYLAIIVQIIGGALGFALIAFLSLYTTVLLPPLFFVAYSLLWLTLSWILPSIYRV